MAQIRGTTPVNIFTVDIDLRPASLIFLTYSQGEGCCTKVILEKTKEDMQITEDTVTVRLSQEDTLAFDPHEKITMQFRAKFGNTAVACKPMVTGIGEILKQGVI